MLHCLVSVVDINDSSNHGLAYAHCYKIEFLVFRERERGGGVAHDELIVENLLFVV